MKLLTSICVSFVLLLCCSCDSDLEKSLKKAGDNRTELEKVLSHFRNDPDPLKYEAAKFLIENMSSQSHPSGPAVDRVDSIYLSASGESHNTRTSYLNTAISTIGALQAEMVCDISTMKADYLIKAIDDACTAWNSSTWHEDYDISLFFEYVLPYRLIQEPISDWHEAISSEFPMLPTDVVISRRGLQFEAEDAQCVGCETKEYVGAANGKAEMMFPRLSSVSYAIESERSTQKRLIVKYSSVAKNLSVLVRVNEGVADTIRLSPTRNIESFSEKWFNIPISIPEGKSTVSIFSPTDTLCLDYIQLGAVEPFHHNELCDFSTDYYNLVNMKSRHCVAYDTATAIKEQVIDLKPYSTTDSTQLLRLDYAGYPLWRIGYFKKDSIDMCLQMEFGMPNTLLSEAPVTAGQYVKRPFDQWAFLPLGDNVYRIMNKHTGLFLDTKTEPETGREILIQNKFSKNDSQKWLLRRQGTNPYADRDFTVRSAISEAMRVFDLTHQFEYYIYSSPYEPKASSLFKAKSGKCADETSFSIFLCRHLGIPAAYDFTPHWGNRSSNHSWSVLVNPDGKSTPFYMGNFPGDTAHYFHSYIKPKVFRYRYSQNKQMIKDFASETSAPKLFVNPHYTDVTDEYCETTDVERPVPSKYNNRVAYICVFDNRNWVPVHYGKVHSDKVTFTAMGRGIVYMASILENGTMTPLGNPFLLTNEGEVKELKAGDKRTDMTLLRKYPFMGAQDFFNSRMNGGQFQGSNKRDFSDSTVFHTHKGITNGNWYNIPVATDKKFRFLRYIGGKGSYCNINELEFYGLDGQKLEGTIIGTEGEPGTKKERVFDGNILTGFGGNSPDGNWVGLELEKPTQISRIKYIGRNDGNCIEIGDDYELYYWSTDGDWELLGSQKATSNALHFSNIPSGGLYILKDITKGVEERIFTYENGKQVWW